ncbi:Protein hgh1 [Microsporum ferrugineum]
MPSELEELVDFLHHGNTQIRQIACENLVGYSASQPALFKRHQLLPVRDLKLLVRDYPPIAKDALTILVNLSADEEVLKELAEDDAFLETLLKKVTNPKERAVSEITMLLANLAKSDSIRRIVSLERAVPEGVSTSSKAMDQLMDCFIKGGRGGGGDGAAGDDADRAYDYLSYFFADISKFQEGRAYFVTEQAYDSVIPITKLTVFTEHRSHVRRRGVASTIKNVAFEVSSHPSLMSESEVNLLPYILLPLAGPEEFGDEESSSMLPDLQLLPPDKQRDPDPDILTAHLETLLLLTSTREGRDTLRRIQIYPLVRECHLHTANETVQEACDRLVQVIMRDEEGEGDATEAAMNRARLELKDRPDDEDEKVVDVF